MNRRSVYVLGALMVLLLAVALCGCGSEAIEIGDHNIMELGFGDVVAPEKTVSADELMASVEYCPEMFKGHHTASALSGGAEPDSKGIVSMGTVERSYVTSWGEPKTEVLSVLPLQLGADVNYALKNSDAHNWMEMVFAKEDGFSTVWVDGVFELEGNVLHFYPFDYYDYEFEDGEYKYVTYRISAESWDYTFRFEGINLILTADCGEVTLSFDKSVDSLAGEGNCKDIYCNCEADPDGEKLDGIMELSFRSTNRADREENDYFYVYNDPERDYHSVKACGVLGEDNLFTFSFEDDDGNVHSYQLLYFYCGSEGMVLYDGEQYYDYTYEERKAVTYPFTELKGLSPEEKALLEEKKACLMDELAAACTDAGINVTIDKENGEIAIDSAILFDVNDYSVSEEGKAFLDKFVELYGSIVLKDEYKAYISLIQITGHTDTNGGSDYNQTLSENRAKSVMSYCISAEPAMADLVNAKGIGSESPVYNDDGSVNMDASRRVTFNILFGIKDMQE